MLTFREASQLNLTDTFNKSVSVEDSAHAEIDAIRGIQFTEDTSRDGVLQGYENSKRSGHNAY